MLQFIAEAAAAAASGVRSAYGAVRGVAARAEKKIAQGFERDPEAMARHRRKPGKYPKPRTPIGEKVHTLAEVGNASWGVDAIAARFDSSAPTYSELVNIKVYGQAWSRLIDLYVLGMCILVARVDARNWQGAQGIRVQIDVTGKYVEIEFQMAKLGLAQRIATAASGKSPFVMFNDPGWLSNRIAVQGRDRVNARMPDVLSVGNLQAGVDAARRLFDLEFGNPLIDSGAWTEQIVAAQGPAGSGEGLLLTTHERELNPAPISDGTSRGTDLCALVTQVLHETCEAPPLPPTDRLYDLADGPVPQGCRPEDGTGVRGRIFDWLRRGFLRNRRFPHGWEPARGKVKGDVPVVGGDRPYKPDPC